MSIPERNQIKETDKWDLSSLYPSPEAWEDDFHRLEELGPNIEDFKGKLGDSPQALSEALDFLMEVEQLEERLGYYAHLRIAENVGDSEANGRFGRLMSVSTKVAALGAYFTPEIQSIPEEKMTSFLEDPRLKSYSIYLSKILRAKPYVLSEEGERIIALSGESRTAIRKTFSNLTNVDLKFGEIEVGEEAKPLSQSTFSVFLQNPDPKIRKAAYEQFYGEFKDHEHTLGSLLAGSVQDDVYIARVRGHKSARARSLFPDNVPESVYDNLIGVIHEHLPLLHDYYDFRQKVLGLEKLHHCDVYAPLTDKLDSTIPYDEAVALTTAALEPLGTEYTSTMDQGLKGGWVDRYENKGKRSGAFSAGSFMGDPYILLNYKPDNIRDLFTLAHEAGHSMHSWYSVRNNPFSHYNYTIFEAEVASTFNEQLLAHHLLKTNPDQDFQDYLDGKLLDDAIATIFRQTMFAEFEHLIHREVEEGKGLPLDKLKELYRGLLEQYFGPKVVFEDYSALEGLRIPHFYSAFYVYKYATGLSAAMALSQRVLNGGESETQDYLGFLKSGGSRFPLESLALAGVDMSQEAPIRAAMGLFKEKLDSLKARKGL